jgi:hypothetical protein
MNIILLNAHCDGHVLYRLDEHLVNVGPIDPAKLPISQSLCDQLSDLGRWHAEMCDGMGGPATRLDERLYDEKGAAIWEQLLTELGDGYRVIFPSHEFNEEFPSPKDLRAAQQQFSCE